MLPAGSRNQAMSGPLPRMMPFCVLGRAVVVLERHAALAERVDRGLDVVDGEVEDGEVGRRVVRLGDRRSRCRRRRGGG